MKIGIDTFGCDHARSGLGSYLANFVANLPNDENINFELFGSELDRYTYPSTHNYNFNSVNLIDSLQTERLWHRFRINSFIAKNKYDIIIYPAAERIIPTNFKNHIGIAIINSIFSTWLKKCDSLYKSQLKIGLKNVQRIIASSQFIKEDLISLGLDPNKISVVHSGIDHKLFFPLSDIGTDIVHINPFAIKRPYFIYASRLSGPEKKHKELIKAFSLFKKNTGLPHRLVIAGSTGPYSEEIHKIVYESEYASDIFLTGYFPHESFPKLYCASEACIFPSTNEGVGLPVLESMACGIPVLCSHKGALKEMGGNAPLYFNSDNIEEIAQLMEKVIKDTDLRSSMIDKGLKQANNFSWDKSVQEILNIALSLKQ